MARKVSKVKAQPSGPKALKGSAEAKRKASVILETLCGMRTTQSASEELGIAQMRYYVLETRMLQAMIDALEPQARGRKRTYEAQLLALVDDKKRLEREVLRLQALYRVTQRAVGVKEDKKPATKSKTGKVRRVRRQSRGERVLSRMKPDETPATVPGPTTHEGG